MHPGTRALAIVGIMLCGCSHIGGVLPGHPSGPSNKFLTYAGTNAEIVAGSYLVMFDSTAVSEASAPLLADSLVAGTGGTVNHVFTKTIRGFAADNLNDAWASAVSMRSDVSLVRKDFRVYGKELRGNPWGAVPWNLDRVDQRSPFSLDRDYRFKTGPVGAAPGVPIYILDNGIYKDHAEFKNGSVTRVTDVADVTSRNFMQCSLPVADASHGTSIASIAAGNTLGITPTLIMNVKVLDRNPFGSSCTAGSVNWVATGLEETYTHMQQNNFSRAVINLSFGWPYAVPDVALQIAALQGIGAVVVAAGGNENVDANTSAPANIANVLAVGATTQADSRLVVSATNGSNFGSTIALWAPGDNIKSAVWPTSTNPNPYDSFSGTSVAAPHVAGAVALLWQQNPGMTATQVATALRARATRNMLTGLGAGSVNALLYVGEDAPVPGQMRQIARSGSGGDLRAVQLNANRTRALVAGGDASGPVPFAFAAFDVANLGTGPFTQAGATNPPISNCVAIAFSTIKDYFGCTQTQSGAGEAVVAATNPDDVSNTIWRTSLGSGSSINGMTYGFPYVSYGYVNERVFAVATRPNANPSLGNEVFVTSLDADDGHQVLTAVLTAPGFSEPFHRGVDVVLVETVYSTSSDLVVATYSDSPGSKKTFVWKLDPNTLQIKDWREVPAPALAVDGMFATALAVQILENNGSGINIPGEIFLATTVAVSSGGGTVPWGYIYRMNPDRVTVHSLIEVVKEAQITSLWSGDGDLYFCGGTTRTFPPGNLLGISKPGYAPDYDAFIGKSEGVINTRRWITTFNAASTQNDLGYCWYDSGKAFMVTSDPTSFFVVEFPVY